jgi:DNA/RNA endonuclease YhcR with UshA esterase domain
MQNNILRVDDEIFDDNFHVWNDEVNVDVEYKQSRNKFGRGIQQMYFLDENGNHTRNAFFTLEGALEQLNENFNFENGKNYTVKYLTNYQWKGSKQFQYRNGIDLSDFVYGPATEEELYGDEALDEDHIRVYGIVVEEKRG